LIVATLHTVNKSPYERNALETCLRIARPGASVLLIEDGVYAALRGTRITEVVVSAMHVLSFYVLVADLNARGFDESSVLKGVQLVDYGGFVDLVVGHTNVQAWL
jgi:tRNA 2-thiouridine synthesizing protein B